MQKEDIIIWMFGILVFFLVGFGVIMDAAIVTGVSNSTVTTIVNVTNGAPDLYDVSVSATPIDLNAGNTTIVNCTGLIYDTNGWDDIASVNATLYDTSQGDGTTFDNNFRYQNSSCSSSCNEFQSSTTNASCSCLFPVQYYANNGTWQCNMSIGDAFGLSDTDNSSTFTVNTVLGIGVPSEIDFGNLSVTEISSQIQAVVSNYGNVDINISIRGWGGTQAYSADYNSTAMICDTGNITHEFERYSVHIDDTFGNMTNITNTSVSVPNFNLPIRTNDTNLGNDTNTTYWRLEIPSSVSGICNGTVEFAATQTII